MSKPGPKPVMPIIDWPLLLTYLRKHAGPLARLARQAAMDEPTINRLARGEIQQVRFHQALLLLDLAYDHLPSEDWERVRESSVFAKI